MLSSKQRAWLRARANQMPAGFQIGKNELSEMVLADLAALLSTHELVKIAVHKTVASPSQELAAILAEALDAQIVQVVGRRITIYRPSEKLAQKGKSLQLP